MMVRESESHQRAFLLAIDTIGHLKYMSLAQGGRGLAKNLTKFDMGGGGQAKMWRHIPKKNLLRIILSCKFSALVSSKDELFPHSRRCLTKKKLFVSYFFDYLSVDIALFS